MRRDLSIGQEVFIRVESGGAVNWKVGVVVEADAGKFRVAVKLSVGEGLATVFTVGDVAFGLVDAVGECLITLRPVGFNDRLPKVTTVLQGFYRLDVSDDDVTFLSASELPGPTAEEKRIRKLEEEKAELEKQLARFRQGATSAFSSGPAQPARQPSKGKMASLDLSEEEEEFEEAVEERGDLDDLLRGMEKLWLNEKTENVMDEDQSALDEEIFGAYVTRPKKKASPKPQPTLGLNYTNATASGKLDMRDLVMLEMLNTLRQMRRGESEMDDPDGSLTSNQARSISRSMRAFRQMKNRVRDDPKPLIRRYIEEVKEELGVTAGQVWSLRDYSKRISWGKFRSFQKMFEMQVAVWELLQKGESLQAWAQVTQNLKALHQVTLDQGNWRHAWPICGLSDPAERRRFGGHADEMEVVNQFVKTIEELDKRVHAKSGSKEEDV